MSFRKSELIREKKTGKNEGVKLTARDKDFIKFVTRWWCVSINHYIRNTTDVEIWKRWYQAKDITPEEVKDRGKAYRNLRLRMSKLASANVPLLDARQREHEGLIFWATKEGGDLIYSPFKTYRTGNITRSDHSFASCDVGMAIERCGFQVYSERELSAGVTIDRKEIWRDGEPLNATPGSKSINPNHGRRPDLAVPCEDGKYIFIEVEKRLNGSRDYYEKKLRSYYDNDDIKMVIYVVTDKRVATRLQDVNNKVRVEYAREMGLVFLGGEFTEAGYFKTSIMPGGQVYDLLVNNKALKLDGSNEGEVRYV